MRKRRLPVGATAVYHRQGRFDLMVMRANLLDTDGFRVVSI